MPYVYDTYAVLEYLSGNRRYARYFEEDYGFLTVLNLMEVYYAVLTRFGEEAAEEAYSAAATFLLEFDEEDVKEAI